jgi:hypothetical protein
VTARRLPPVPLAVAVGVAVAFTMLAVFVRDHACTTTRSSTCATFGGAAAAPYHVVDAPIAPDVHFLAFQRDGE